MKTKIAFVYYGDSTFVEHDYTILSKHFDVRKVQFNGVENIYDIYKAVMWADATFSWFADVWSFIAVATAKLFKKKSVVVVGGYDVECLKDIGYGMCTKPWWRRWMRTFTINNATPLLAVSQYTKSKAQSYLKYPRDIEMVYNAVDTNYFIPNGKKENIVLTVASGGNNDIIALKGLDAFVKLAKYIQDTKFVVVGLDEKNRYELSKIAISDNIKLIGKLPRHELLKWYQRAKVYCQLSKVESFGMSLAEAMACECVPLYMDVGALHEVVGTTGFVMLNDRLNDEQEVKQTKQEQRVRWIKKAMDYNINMSIGYLARKRIQQNFSIEEREQKLIQLLEKL